MAQGRQFLENDPRKLRPGEIDAIPEVRPAKADAIDMDDEDKEMIAEAKVRIANVKGKKAKRKARERVLDEARRLAQLQKFRELRNAGVDFVIERKQRNKKKEFSYGKEVPLERKPVELVYKIEKEERNDQGDPNLGNININRFEGERRDEVEARRKKQDMRKIKKLRKQNLFQKGKHPSFYIKKFDLVLPEPLLSDQNLEDLVKLRKRNRNEIDDPFKPTNFLLQKENLDEMEGISIRTPRPLNRIMESAREASYYKNPNQSTILDKSMLNDSISLNDS